MTPAAGAVDAPPLTTGHLPLDQLDPDHWPNPRGLVDTTGAKFAELLASIRAQGILEPIVIGESLDELGGRHAIVAGWRRYSAAVGAGLATVPVHHRPDITTERQALEAALAENMAREDMTPVAEATAIARLVELGRTQVEAAQFVGVSERTARERLRLLDLPEMIRDAIDQGDVPTTCTRQLQQLADVCPAAAVSVAKRIKSGKVQAHQLLAPAEWLHVLGLLHDDANIPFVELKYYVDPKLLGLPPTVSKDLGARSAKANARNNMGSRAAVNMQTGEVGKKLLDKAAAAGCVLRLKAPRVAGYSVGDVVFLGGAVWTEAAATAVIEKAERRGARLEREREKAKAQTAGAATDDPIAAAKAQTAGAATDDPIAAARAERDALEAAITERAQPYAKAMNAELAHRLQDLQSCPIDGPVARLLISLLGQYQPLHGVREAASYANRYIGADRGLGPDLEPGQMAAEIVRAAIGAAFCDPRANGHAFADHEVPTDIAALAAGVKLELPDRAVRLAAARQRLRGARVWHNLSGARRRILFELDHATDGLDSEALLGACDYKTELRDLVDVRLYVAERQLIPALEQLLESGEITGVERDGALRYAITDDGRAALAATPGPAPLLEDIDGTGVDLQLVDEPAPHPDDAGDVDRIVLDRPERSVPAKERRTRALELITEHPGITIPALADGMALKQNALYRLLPGLEQDGLIRKDGRGWHPAAVAAKSDVVIVHVTPDGGGKPVKAELQPDAKGRLGSRKVRYPDSGAVVWVHESRITDLPADKTAAAA